MDRKNKLRMYRINILPALLTMLISSFAFAAESTKVDRHFGPTSSVAKPALPPDWFQSLPSRDFRFQAVFKTNQSLTSSSNDSPERTTNSTEDIVVALTQRQGHLYFSANNNVLFTEVDKNGNGCVYMEREVSRSTRDWDAKERFTFTACLIPGQRVSFGGSTRDFNGNNSKTGHWVVQLQKNTPINGQGIQNWNEY